jgi:hypothetical protein
MRHAAAGPEARCITRLKYGLARLLLQDQLALEQIDELVLLFVPVAQRGGRARLMRVILTPN